MGKTEILNDLNSGTFTEGDLEEINNAITTKKLKVNLITVNIAGDQFKFMNSTTTPNTELFDGANGIPTNRRRFANNITIRCRTTIEDKIFSTIVPLISVLASWGYVIVQRQRLIDETDASKITNVLDLEKRAIDLG